MDLRGLALASRYSYPPNSMSLCGPPREKDLSWYSSEQKPDKGTVEILAQFKTLYPYLTLIAANNHIKDPFDKRVVEAYWIGNNLLHNIPFRDYIRLLDDPIALLKKENKTTRENIYTKVTLGALPHHSFHVLNIYKRTGNIHIPHTVKTMDACIINWGKIVKILKDSIVVVTRPLCEVNGVLTFGPSMNRELIFQGYNDIIKKKLHIGDIVSYHWGFVCEKLTKQSTKRLESYTNLSLSFANQHA